jgi:restriction system protein
VPRSTGGPGVAPVAVVTLAGAAVLLGPRAARYLHAHAGTIVLVGVLLLLALAGIGVLSVQRSHDRAQAQAARDRDLAHADTMTGPEFEQYVARLMRRTGFREVRVSGGAGDLGADIVAQAPDGRRVVVQCKRYGGAVGDPHIQKFNGTVRAIHNADVALFVTTGRPTARAYHLAERCGITLVDRAALGGWAADGVVPLPAPA